jgi:sulfur relay (sulfurtransferase) DsrF/TusC family protein
MAKTTKLAFLVQRAGYKCENPKLALTHAISSQSVEIYLEDGDSVVPVVAFVGEGVLNCKNNQKAMEVYGITSTENHVQNALLCDIKVLVCQEDLARFGMSAADLPDASAMGADATVEVVPWETIHTELKGADHLLFF